MKKISLTFVTALLLVLVGCKAIDSLTQFEIESSSTFTIPAALGVDLPINLPTPDVKTNISEKLENKQSNKELIEKLELRYMSLNIENASSQTFRFLKHVDLYLKTDNLPRIKIAFKHDIPNSIGAVLEMNVVENVDLQEYIKSDDFILDAEITTDEITLQAIQIRSDMTYWVDAKILGI